MQAYISLNANAPDGKLSRYYCLYLTKDLLRDMLLTTYYGGAGKKGRYLYQVCHDTDKIRRSLRAKLSKRLNAVKRIGCNYQIVQYRADEEFESQVLQGRLKELVRSQH